MRRRILGRTGAEVPELIFGCGMVAGLLIDKPMEEMCAVAERALQAGIDWFDTAELYGQGRSETHLGELLRKLGASARVSTKINLGDDEMTDIPAAMEAHARASLDRLGMDRVDLLQLHNRIDTQPGDRKMTRDQVLGPGGAIEGLERLRDAGLCDWIGITALGDNELCQETIASARIDTAQVYINMVNPSAGMGSPGLAAGQEFAGMLDVCAAHDVGVIAIRALASGLLAEPDPGRNVVFMTKDTDVGEEVRRAKALIDLLVDRYGNPAQTALRFVLADPRVACIDFAPGEMSHLEEALAAAEADPMDAADVAAVREFSRRP